MSFTGTFFDGSSIKGRKVEVDVQGDHSLILKDGDYCVVAPSGTFSISGPLATIPRFALLPGGYLEVDNTCQAGTALAGLAPPSTLSGAELWLGARTWIAAGISAALVAVCMGFVLGGLPALARRIALAVPSAIEAQIGRASQVAIKKYQADLLFGSDRDAEVRMETELRNLARVRHLHVDPILININLAQANAFALPGGTIVVTTGLLRLGLTDEEMEAVLAHELGHEELRHGLQSILRQSSALIIVSVMTGDLATLTSFSSSLPLLLLTRGYSRDFEREADAYAVDLLRSDSVDPKALASALEKLEKANGNKKVVASYLSTHPDTEERIAAIRSTAYTLVEPADYGRLLRRARELFPADSKASVTYFERAFRLRKPEATDLYDAAVSAAFASDPDSAFPWLYEAIRLGLNDSKTKLNSHLLDNLHSDPRWSILTLSAQLETAEDLVRAKIPGHAGRSQ